MATTVKINGPVALSAAAQKQLLRLINNLAMAQTNTQKMAALHEAAQETEALAQSQANNFVTYLAEELNIPLGQEGWKFVQDTMSFERVEPPAEPERQEN